MSAAYRYVGPAMLPKMNDSINGIQGIRFRLLRFSGVTIGVLWPANARGKLRTRHYE